MGLIPPTHTPKATETIKEIIQLVQNLMDKGLAYQSERGYFLFYQSPFPLMDPSVEKIQKNLSREPEWK